jgi:cell division protein FtsI (penicillin-binding protein 3)
MLLLVVVLVFCGISLKLMWIQGVDAAGYVSAGSSEWQQTVNLSAERGAILDRNGNDLALSVPRPTVYADPHQVADPVNEASALAPVLGIPASTLYSELTEPVGFVYLARTVSEAVGLQVSKLNLPGIYILQEPKPFYPAGQLALPLLGSVGTAGNGLSGLEYKYNSILTGKPGKMVEEVNPSGQELPGGLKQYQAPVDGDDLVTTLDEPLQYDAEEALAQAIVAARASSGMALVMDSKTGEILADAELQMPGCCGDNASGTAEQPAVPVRFSANGTPGGANQPQPVESPSATSFTSVYEPGSVEKLITISAALQAGVIVPSDTFTIPNTYELAGTAFHDAESHPTEHWNVTDIVANSSNIGTLQIAEELGQSRLVSFLEAFGLGSASAVGFPGESAGLLPSYWSGTTLADVAFGQGVAVTAIQMLDAYNTIANGGIYVPPRLVDGYVDSRGTEHPFTSGEAPHRVVSPLVAAQMTAMLEQVVQVGTGQAASLEPYTVAGKTGTALVPSPSGGYEPGTYVASFAGFVPAENPQITAMVVVEDTHDYGAAASAPTFAKIARDALQLLRIPPQPKQPAVAGVPITNSETATAAGEVAGAPLPGLTAAGAVPEQQHPGAAAGPAG